MRTRGLVGVLLLVAACSSGTTAARTSTTSTSTNATPAPVGGVTTTTVLPPVAGQPATPECPAVPVRAVPDPDRPRYRLRMDVQPSASVVPGDLTVRFTPDLDTDRLVFRLWPNGPKLAAAGAKLDVGPVSLDGAEPRFGDIPEPTTLVVPLGRTLRAHQTVTASLPWRLALPATPGDRIAQIGDTVRLGSFFPILSWEAGHGWATEPATANFAEASTAPTADFDLTISAPPELQVLATGTSDGNGRWSAPAVRDVAVSVGRFRVAEGLAGPVRVVVAVEAGLPADPEAYLGPIAAAVDSFARQFGPYPWPSYTVSVTPGLSGGIEYPMHVLQGPGSEGRTTPHEVGHQWFYGLVGNDQGRDPWLDEGLASWAEARFRGSLGEFAARQIPTDAQGRTGLPMTFWEGRSSYYAGVYVQGTQALAALGSPERVDCALRLYVAGHAHRIARPDDLVIALEQVFPDARAVLARFGAVPAP